MDLLNQVVPKLNGSFKTLRIEFKRGFLVAGVGLMLSGCASNMAGESLSTQISAPASDSTSSATIQKGPANTQSFGAANGTAQLIQAVSTVPRRIIYNAKVELISENFAKAQDGLAALVKTHGGYIAETDIGGTPGQPRQGTWKVRVPESQFNAFMSGVSSLGELQSTHTDSQDVTAEFHDLEARISNKQVEEKRLIAHLQRSTAKLSDILQVERELSRVRGEIEQMQG